MDHIVTAIVSAISPAVLPIVVCVLGCCFIYLKIGKDRKQTNIERDNQVSSQHKHFQIL